MWVQRIEQMSESELACVYRTCAGKKCVLDFGDSWCFITTVLFLKLFCHTPSRHGSLHISMSWHGLDQDRSSPNHGEATECLLSHHSTRVLFLSTSSRTCQPFVVCRLGITCVVPVTHDTRREEGAPCVQYVLWRVPFHKGPGACNGTLPQVGRNLHHAEQRRFVAGKIVAKKVNSDTAAQ